jgi:hypothetical protein
MSRSQNMQYGLRQNPKQKSTTNQSIRVSSDTDEGRDADDQDSVGDPSYMSNSAGNKTNRSKKQQKKPSSKSTPKPPTSSKPVSRRGRPPGSGKKSSVTTLSSGESAGTPKTVEEQLVEWKRKYRILETKVEKVTQDLRDAKESGITLQKTADRLQSEHAQLISKNKIEVSTDDDLDLEYSMIFSQTKIFAKEWTQKVLTETSRTQLADVFSSLTRDPQQPFATNRFLDEAEAGLVKPMVMANVLLNASLCSLVFQRPFAHLEFDPTGYYKPDTEETLLRLMVRANQSESSANI